jgi:hypothetical protein
LLFTSSNKIPKKPKIKNRVYFIELFLVILCFFSFFLGVGYLSNFDDLFCFVWEGEGELVGGGGFGESIGRDKLIVMDRSYWQ